MSDENTRLILQQLEPIKETLQEVRRQVAATNGRVRALEEWKAWMEGVRAGYSWVPVAVAGSVASVVSVLLTRFLG